MKEINIILKNINILNLLLLATSIFIFIQSDFTMFNGKIKVTIPQAKEISVTNQENISDESRLTYSDFALVAEKNIFHPERKIPITMGKSDDQTLAKPEIVLYGTLITSEKKIAYVEDKKNPYSTPGRGKRQIAVTEGGMISGFTLKEVNPESILLIRGEEKLTIKLSDKKDRKPADSIVKPQIPGQIPTQIPGQIPPQPPIQRPVMPRQSIPPGIQQR